VVKKGRVYRLTLQSIVINDGRVARRSVPHNGLEELKAEKVGPENPKGNLEEIYLPV